MTTRKPRPVRAWARALDMDEYVHEDRVGFKVCAWKRGEGDVQVTVHPDGTPSQAAEVRRLRRALRKVRDTIGPTIPWCCAGGGCEIEAALSDIDAALRGRRGR